MKKKMIVMGNGWCVYMQKHVLQLLNINPNTAKVVFEIENKVLKITQVKGGNFEHALVRKFIKSGHGWGIYVPNSVLELLDINPESDYIECEVNKNVLLIKKAPDTL